jgi:hypothetical protein
MFPAPKLQRLSFRLCLDLSLKQGLMNSLTPADEDLIKENAGRVGPVRRFVYHPAGSMSRAFSVDIGRCEPTVKMTASSPLEAIRTDARRRRRSMTE